MATIADDFAGILGTVRRPGDFHASGRVELLAPRIEVEGVGPIALPLLPMQAEQLVAAAERAPYGRGAETLVDTAVRRTWQIGPEQVRIAGKRWEKTLDEIVERAAAGLGVSEPVAAELYKLLIYDKGSFFVSHRDTEKAPGMFATLVLALPSQSEGGELVVRHKGREARLDLRTEDPSEIAFAAFYADCVHEVRPVTAGCRATLVYNLVRKDKKGAAPQPPSYDSETERTVALLRGWAEAKDADSDGAPKKLIYLLEHAYTPAELGFAALKGADAAAAGVLLASAPQAGCELHLALLQIEESGIAEYTGYRSRRGREAVDMVAGEVCDGDRYLHEWRRSDGAPSTLGSLPFEDEEVSPPDALEDMEPDEEHFHEATGNEGASFDRTYSRAALVVWPGRRTLAVLNQAGLSATLPYLADLVARCKGEGAKPGSPPCEQALEMAGHMLGTWPAGKWHSFDNRDSKPSEMGRMLALLTDLGAKDEAGRLLEKLVDRRGHDKADNAAILGALALFPPERAAGRLKNILASGGIEAFGACSALLAGAIRSRFASKPAMLLKAAEALVEALPGDPALAPKNAYGRPLVATVGAAAAADLAVALDAVDGALAQRAAHHMLAWPRHFSLDEVLVPAVRRLVEAGTTAGGGAAFETLHAACLAHLKARAAGPLEAPQDWSRPSGVGCKCEHCTALSRFLADAAKPSWSLKAAQPIRDHVGNTIRNARCDVTTATDTRGRPQTLICTKNQASYERRVAQRKRDLADIAALERVP